MSRPFGLWFLVAAATTSLLASSVTVHRHARGVRAVHGLDVWITAVDVGVGPGDDLAVTLAASSSSGFPVELKSVKMTVLLGQELVAARSDWSLSIRVEGEQVVEFAVPLDPVSTYEEPSAMESLAAADVSLFTASVWLSVVPDGSRRATILTISVGGRQW